MALKHEGAEADLKWQLEGSSTEANTFYVHTKEGGLLLVQIVYSTMSWSPSIQITVRYYNGHGAKQTYTSNVGGASFKPSEDGLSVDCEGFKVLYLKEAKEYQVKLQGVSACALDFTFKFCDDFVRADGGKIPFNSADISEGYISSQLVPKGEVEGFVSFSGQKCDISGSALFIKALQKRPQCVGRWNFVDLQGDKDALILYQFEMPAGNYDLKYSSQGYLNHDGKTIAVTLDNYATHLDCKYDAFSGYKVPTHISYKWSGQSLDGRPLKASLEMPLTNLLDKIDILSELPWMVKKFIQTLITAPYVYQWLEKVEVAVELGEEKFTIAGQLFHESTFMYELNKD